MKKKIILGPSSYCEISNNPIELLQHNGFEVIKNPYGRKLIKKELLNLIDKDVVGIIAGLEIIDKEIIKSSNIKVISRVGTGTDNLDLDYLKKNDIAVYTTPEAPVQAVAELTIGSIITLIRRVQEMSQDLRSGIWKKKIGLELKSKNVFIIGFGRIGQKVAKLLNAFECNIYYHDPFVENHIDTERYLSVNLEEGLKRADIISLHLSGNKEIFEDRHFELMKDGVFLLNPSRGGLINEKLLKKYLDNGKLQGVWLDAFSNEPYNGDLINHDKCLLTPHAASYSRECRIEMEIQAAQNIINYFIN